MMKRYSFIKYAVLTVALIIGASLTYHTVYRQPNTSALVSDYNQARDYQDMLALFKQDWYWLSAREYDKEQLDFSINTGSPNEYESRYFGTMRFKVLREASGAFVGFVSYYMKSFYEGAVLYLAVHPEFRGKRYGQMLLDAAVDELKKQGASIVSLVTWTNNVSSNKLYQRYGFVKNRIEGNYVFYEKPI